MKRVWLCLSVTAMLLAACAKSDRRLELPGKDLTVGAPTQISPARTMPFAFDSKGELMAVMQEDKENQVEIRSVNTLAPIGSNDIGDAFPFMFRNDAAALYCAGPNGILELDLATNRTKLLAEGYAYMPIGRNASQTLTVLADPQENFIAVNNHGNVLSSKSHPRFDQYGNAWVEAKDAWQMLAPHQPAVARSSRPNYLVIDQSGLRGGMQLVTNEETVTRKGAEAHVSTIWLDHSQATGDKRSALVFVGADVYYSGFVPDRDLIWVITEDSSYLVPLTIAPKPTRAAIYSK